MTSNVQASHLCSNAETLDRTRMTIAGGGSSNMRIAGLQDPIVVDRSAGCRVWDVEGNEFIDVNMGYGPHLFGYGDPDVLGAVAEQLALGAVTGLPHRLDHEAGELLAELVPSVEQVRFANSGTEAIASTLRLARFVTGRNLVVTFRGHYHGWSETVLRAAAITTQRMTDDTDPLPGAPGMIPGALAYTLQRPFNDLGALEKVFAEHGEELAAVIVEPVCANYGVVAPRPEFLARLVELGQAHGALTVFDEVITGFRVSAGGAQEYYGVEPDLTVVSKVLGGGFPVAAFGGRRQVMAPLARNEAFHAGVYAGNHAAVAAVVATLNKIRGDGTVYKRLERKAAVFEQRLREELTTRPVRLTRVGSLMSFALLTEEGDDAYDASIDKIDFLAHKQLQVLCQRDGVYFHPNPLEPWFLSTAHTAEDLEAVIEVIAKTLRQI